MTLPKSYPLNATLILAKHIHVPSNRGRENFKHVPELITSITEIGLITPLVVTEVKPGGKLAAKGKTHRLVAGQSRFNALVVSGIDEIPCDLFKNLSPLKQKEIELTENLIRKSLEWHEQTKLMHQIHELKTAEHGSKSTRNPEGWTTEKTAEILNRPSGTVGRMISIEKEFRDRPDIKEQVKGLPLNVATKKVVEIKKQEKLARLEKAGKLKFSSKLRNGSCLELIKEVKPDSVDLVVTDPPFGVSEIENERETDRGDHESYKRVLEDSDNLSLSNAKQLVRDLVPELFRVLKPGSHCYMFFAFDLFGTIRSSFLKAGFDIQPYPLIWDKGRTTSIFKGYSYSPCFEPIFFAIKPPKVRRLKESDKAIITEKIIPTAQKIHPFEKPQPLLRRLIEQSSNKGDLILDPFAGSGSTLVASQSLGRSGLGFELSRNNFLRAQERLMGGEERDG